MKPQRITPRRWKKLLIGLIRLVQLYGEENVDSALLQIMTEPTLGNARWARQKKLFSAFCALNESTLMVGLDKQKKEKKG